MNTKEIIRNLDLMDTELMLLREKVEFYRTTIKKLTADMKALDKESANTEKELARYKEAESKGLIVTLPVQLGSMTFQVIPDTKDTTGKTYKITQHVFALEDVPAYEKTVFKSDTEAMVVAMSMTEAAKAKK